MDPFNSKYSVVRRPPDQPDEASALDGFHGCYLLVSLNPRCSGRTTIPDPNSAGRNLLVVKAPVVHGFPNDISALRNPYQSRRVPYVPPKSKRETPLQFRFRVLCNMLRVRPWSRLGLTIRLNLVLIPGFYRVLQIVKMVFGTCFAWHGTSQRMGRNFFLLVMVGNVVHYPRKFALVSKCTVTQVVRRYIELALACRTSQSVSVDFAPRMLG
ncbi:hypothetical protein TcWFU_009761 [Taenia crassiceps]|uniref:Uncharacterized protein n=1 Tax=Taenia crassiceps TaxID=6207 RepID=A0ABR4QMD7_9CEST